MRIRTRQSSVHTADIPVIATADAPPCDPAERAEQFVEDYGTASFTMLWDETHLAWNALGVTSSPTAGLFAADGSFIAGWVGPLPEDVIVRLAEESIADAG